MRKVLMLIVCAMCCVTSFAQNLTEVLYLKNGSMIKGVIIEQVPNQTVKIQTADGSIFVYQMTEVLKITKEAKEIKSEKNYDAPSTNGLHRGFRAIVEAGYGDYGDDMVSLNAAAGFQLNPYIFLGAGAGVRYFTNNDTYSVPIFANFRSDFINRRITPFVDAKIGYSPTDVTGMFASVGLGCRFKIGDNFALSASAGYEAQETDVDAYYGYYYSSTDKETAGEAFIRVGIEF